MAEHLERASTARSRCRLCKEPIEKGALRLGVSGDSARYDGTMTVWHHGICAAIRRPTGFLRALADYPGVRGIEREQFEAIANATRSGKLSQVIWRHANEPRCVLEFAAQRYLLVTCVAGKSSIAWGPLDEVVASVPDEDLEAVVDTATASGKSLVRDDAIPAKPKSQGLPRQLRQRFESKQGSMTYSHEVVLDEAKRVVTQVNASGPTGKPLKPYGKPTRRTFETVELAAKYFRYCLARRAEPRVEGDPVELDPQEDFKDVKDKSADYRYLEHPTSKQFWDIDRDSSTVIVCKGAIGTPGTETTHESNWDGDAKAHYKRLLADQLAAGYIEPPGFAGRRATGKR